VSFAYTEATSVAEALRVVSECGPDARLLAGGTDVGVLLRRRRIRPTHLVSIARIPELRHLRETEGCVVVGAAVCHRQIERSPLLTASARALQEACATVGPVQIRNVGTVGGNLANASPAADTPPVLLALGAEVTLAGPAGTRTLPLERFFLGYRQTALAADELIRDVRFPQPPPGTGTAFEKLGRRRAMEISIACVGALLTLEPDGRTCREVRIGLGAVAPTPVRARAAEAALRGRVLTPAAVDAAAREAAAECAPIDDLRASAEYRRLAVEALVRRALHRAATRAGLQPQAAGR
jgi:carbon-monoxide dehydrogenase medium subunit